MEPIPDSHLSALALPPEARQERILEKLLQLGRVSAQELAREFGTSEHTVRRDLAELSARGLCQRVHGGALRRSPASAPALSRRNTQVQAKAALGRLAARQAISGQVVFIDAGSTNLAIAQALDPALDLTLLTNAPAIAEALAERGHTRLIQLGGSYYPQVGGCVGAIALSQLQLYRPDLCFLGACALDAQQGVTCFDAEDAAFKRELVRASASVVVAVTQDKLTSAAPFRVCEISALDVLVTESGASESTLQSIAEYGVRIERNPS